MSHLRCGARAGALAAVLLLALLVTAAGATPVSVRVEGVGVGVERDVETTAAAIPGGCPGHSAGGALDKAVDGNWDRMAFVSTILGESHVYAANDYWSFWINDAYSTKGLCDYTVGAGDRVLIFVQRDGPGFMGTVFPLTLAGVPSSVTAGVPFTVTVREQRTDGTTTTPVPVAGATVGGAVTDAQGRATITIDAAGPAVLRATRAGNVRSDAARLMVVAAASPERPTVVPVAEDVAPVPPDRIAHVTIQGIADGTRFAAGKGPRRIQALVDEDRSGIFATKLRLTRTDRGRCTYFSGRVERFVKTSCGAAKGAWFRVGDQPQVDYLLPGALPRGRYVLDANVIDKAYNRDDARRRGANRIVFSVG